MSALCVKCLRRLYTVNNDMIVPFDDIMILIRLLDTVGDIELQHALVDVLLEMCRDDHNLQLLLNPEFVSIMCQLASYAHLNSDQIGNLLHRQTHQLLLTAGEGTEMKVNRRDNMIDSVGSSSRILMFCCFRWQCVNGCCQQG